MNEADPKANATDKFVHDQDNFLLQADYNEYD